MENNENGLACKNGHLALVNKRTNAPDWLIKETIGVCKCMQRAVEMNMPLHIIKMYARESERIAKKYNEYVC